MRNDEPRSERRQTRIVFPNGNATVFWGILSALMIAWITWMSSSIVELKVEAGKASVGRQSRASD